MEHPELKPLLSELVRAQGAEVNQLRRWRQQWFGSGATPPISQTPRLSVNASVEGSATTNMEAEIVRLHSTPAPIDRALLDAIIPHHQDAIGVAHLVEQQATRPELKEIARTMIERQQREIEQLSRWRQDWYGSASQRAGAPGGGMAPGTGSSQGTPDGQVPHQGH